MRLLYLELKGQYKGLEDQQFDFSTSSSDIIALVGLNGAGKSNLLELLAEIFCVLDSFKRPDFKNSKLPLYDFDLIYRLPSRRGWEVEFKVSTSEESLLVQSRRYRPSSQLSDEEFSDTNLENLRLPDNIVGYSSGLNENLQIPFLKSQLKYLEALSSRKRLTKNYISKLSDAERFEDEEAIRKTYETKYPHIFNRNRGFTRTPISTLLDYDSIALLVASLCVLPTGEIYNFCRQINFESISRFKIEYSLKGTPYTGDELTSLSDLMELESVEYSPSEKAKLLSEDEIDNAFAEASDNIIEEFYDEGTLETLVTDNPELKGLFPVGPPSFFKDLYRIQLLGTKHWDKTLKQSLAQDDREKPIRKPSNYKPTLKVTELYFIRQDGTEINFFDLSDGECQLIQTLAAIRVFNEEKTLFLLDEPDTHLNPHWRTEFHKHIEYVNSIQSDFTSSHQILISTHSPFMLSSLDNSNVYRFTRNEGRVSVEQEFEQTFGASFEYLSKRIFNMDSLISRTAVETINGWLSEMQNGDISKEEAIERLTTRVGSSLEKTFLIKRIVSYATSD